MNKSRISKGLHRSNVLGFWDFRNELEFDNVAIKGRKFMGVEVAIYNLWILFERLFICYMFFSLLYPPL